MSGASVENSELARKMKVKARGAERNKENARRRKEGALTGLRLLLLLLSMASSDQRSVKWILEFLPEVLTHSYFTYSHTWTDKHVKTNDMHSLVLLTQLKSHKTLLPLPLSL